jgi:hypothetical protein
MVHLDEMVVLCRKDAKQLNLMLSYKTYGLKLDMILPLAPVAQRVI